MIANNLQTYFGSLSLYDSSEVNTSNMHSVATLLTSNSENHDATNTCCTPSTHEYTSNF